MNQIKKKFWKWKNQDGNESDRVLEMYGSIAEDSWYDDDITPKMFHDELFAGKGPVTIWLSSPGGDCVAASQIYAMLMDYPSDVTVKIDGIAASAASVIAMAGTRVLMAPTAMMMCHDPMTIAFGNSEDMEKAIAMLDEVKESIINAYEIKTGLSRAKIAHLMKSETWMNANKAIELGFADGILEDEKRTPQVDAALSFSGNAARIALRNKLEVTAKLEDKEEPAEEPVEEPKQEEPVTETPEEPEETEPEGPEETQPEETGTPINELEKRLNLLK